MKKIVFSFEICIVLFMLAAGIWVAVSPQGKLLNWYQTDDAFYYFKVAQNISEGKGITFDGLSPTNGFHPLWMLICIPIFALARFNLILPLRVLVLISSLFNAATGVLIYRLIARTLSRETGWLVTIFWMLYPSIFSLTTMLGMESGINAFSIVLLIYLLANLPLESRPNKAIWKDYLILGLAAILTLFSRLDNIFLVAMLGAWLVLRRTSLRWQLMLDFILILVIGVISYYARVQTTTNIFNFLPFAYLFMVLSLALKPLGLYLMGVFKLNQRHSGTHVLMKIALAITLTSGLIFAVIFFMHDVLKVFRGFPRSVLLVDWGLSLLILSAVHLIFNRSIAGRQKYKEEDISWKNNWVDWLQHVAAYFGPLAIALGGYMGFNLAYAGTALPVSGQIKRWWGTLPNTVYGTSIKTLSGIISGWFSPTIKDGPWSLIARPLDGFADWISRFPFFSSNGNLQLVIRQNVYLVLWIILILAVIWLIYRQRDWAVATFDRLAILPFLAGCILHITSYKATGYLHAKFWYWISELVFTILAGGVVLECIFCELRKLKFISKQVKSISMLCCAIILGIFVFMLWQLFGGTLPLGYRHNYLEETELIQRNTAPGTVIGMTGGGVTAYFIQDRTVVNLDGLINGKEYFEQLKNGNADKYFARIGMTYVYGAYSMLLDSDPYRWVLAGHLLPIQQFGENTLYRYQFSSALPGN